MFARRHLPGLVRRRVVAQLEGGDSVAGVLIGVYDDAVVIAHAAYLSGEVRTPVDGEVVVPRAKVRWLQALGEEDG